MKKLKDENLKPSTSTRLGGTCSNSKNRYQELCVSEGNLSPNWPDVQNYSLILALKNETDSLKLGLIL